MVEDWNDLHELVTTACYSPDDRLQWWPGGISQGKLPFIGSSLEVLIASADSLLCVVNGDELVHKLKGFPQY